MILSSTDQFFNLHAGDSKETSRKSSLGDLLFATQWEQDQPLADGGSGDLGHVTVAIAYAALLAVCSANCASCNPFTQEKPRHPTIV